jgi:hypothetical protein
MKKVIFPILTIFLAISSLFLDGCFTSTVDSLSKYSIQFPINFYSYFYRRGAPDTSFTFSNLYKHQEYKDNKDKIDNSQILSFNYWIDSLQMDDHHPFDPAVDTLIFYYVRFSIRYAIPKNETIKNLLASLPPDDPIALDSSNWMPDPTSDTIILGEFVNVNVAEYYRNPKYIQIVSEKLTGIITELTKHRPQFYVVTEYSKTVGQTVEERQFPLVWARFDMILRMQVKL